MIEALGIARVKNEADVIEAFVRHNLGFMDAMFIVDNDSVDGTREILVQLCRDGLPIVLFDDPFVADLQEDKITAMYRRVVPKFKPRFVFLLDADEFIVAESREALFCQLRTLPPGVQGRYFWRTYIPAPTQTQSEISDPLRSITYRRTAENPPTPKSIIATKSNIDKKLKIHRGNHDVEYAGRCLPAVELQDIALAHLPVRSVDQAISKTLVGWTTNMQRVRHRRSSNGGLQLKTLFKRITYGPGLTGEDVTYEALRYAQSPTSEAKWPDSVVSDPVKPEYATLTVQSDINCSPLQKFARCIDKVVNPDSILADAALSTDFLGSRFGRRGERIYVDIPPFRYLAERDRPESVLDVGCGQGAYLKYFLSKGTARIMGVDAVAEQFDYLQWGEYRQIDLGKRFELTETFDLVICMGVIADLQVNSDAVLVDNISRHARDRIVFSVGKPGQASGKNSGINRSLAHWLELFATAGWFPSLFDSLAMRSLSTFKSLRCGLVVLTRDASDFGATRERLLELDKETVGWHIQRPRVITHPFTAEAIRDSSKGIGRWFAFRRRLGTAAADSGIDLSVIKALMDHVRFDAGTAKINLALSFLRQKLHAARARVRARRAG